MLEYARWKYILVSVVLLLALLFALPNLFGEDPALQVARKDRSAIDATAQQAVESFLKDQKIAYSSADLDSGDLMVLFPGMVSELEARDAVNERFKDEYLTAQA